jgi:hypothetical protein
MMGSRSSRDNQGKCNRGDKKGQRVETEERQKAIESDKRN